MSLHLIYRPKTFGEVIGNETTVKTIQNKINGEDPPHSIILHGPSGCGKTTLARIISGELGCDIKSNDFVELDIAQLTGVDTAREIRQNMNFLPMESKCRVWLLDDFHKASSSFQNAMLKALEDTPKHVYFILCTTELNKIIKTVQTRCTKFKVEALEDRQINQLIDWVLKGEKFTIPNDVIDEIVAAADGCPRETLVILDQIIDLDPKEMLSAIQQTEADREVKELCQAMLKRADWPKLATILKGMKSIDAERARQAVIAWFASVALDRQGFNKKNITQWNEVAATSALVFDCFKDNLFYTGMSGFIFATYNTTL